MSNADELMKLKELLDSGILTEEEFKSEKEKILGVKPNQNKVITFKTENLVTKPIEKKSAAVVEFANMMNGLLWFGLIGGVLGGMPKMPELLKTYKYLEDMRLEIKDNKIYHRWEYNEAIKWSKKEYKLPYLQYVGDLDNIKWKKSIPLDEVLYVYGDEELIKNHKRKNWAEYKPPSKITKVEDMFQTYEIKGVSKTIKLFIYFRESYYVDEIVKFEKKLFKAIKENSPNCPKCAFAGLRPATRLRDCNTCHWRYQKLKNI
tara:strand:+ start:180 stop:962 length:783 start_codon:yes stop_codon:yes gene_type:complete